MFYLIGLGLNLKGISLEAIELVKKCKKIYLESYTTNLSYKISDLENIIKKKIIKLNRKEVESESFLQEAKKSDIALLVYGSPLVATTHISLLMRARKEKIKIKIFHNASIFDAITETGLQLYKFGKTASMPKWKDNYKPRSFANIMKQNKKINAHTLLLVDISLNFKYALKQLEDAYKQVRNEKIVACSRLGTEKGKIIYGRIDEIKKIKIKQPFCFIIHSNLHFAEKDVLERFEI